MGPLHNIHSGGWIRATRARGAADVGGLWNDIKPFHVAEIHIGGPHRVEDKPDLGKIEPLQ